MAPNVRCVTEDGLMPGVTLDSIGDLLQERFGTEDPHAYDRGRSLAGWYLQQFLKLGAVRYLPDLSDHFLLWDLDMMLLRPLEVFHTPTGPRRAMLNAHGPPRTVVNIGGAYSEGYRLSFEKLTGLPLRMAPDGSSFVTHSMVVYKPYMEELLEALTPAAAIAEGEPPTSPPDPFAWVPHVVRALDPAHLSLGFSEFASYMSWVLTHHSDSVHVLKRKTWLRHVIGGPYLQVLERRTRPSGLCCPTSLLLSVMSLLRYQFTGYEIGHQPACRYNAPEFTSSYGC